MEDKLGRNDFVAAPTRPQSFKINEDETADPSSPSIYCEFNELRCLFCNQENPDVDQNLVHMSKAHGLHLNTTNLLVDIVSLLAYFNLVIFGYYECLYCGTQRSTHQAVQQHMMAKSHCKYDISNKDAELRDFYDLSSSDTEEEVLRNHPSIRFADGPQLPPQARSRKPRPSKRSDRHGPSIAGSPLGQALPTRTRTPHIRTVVESSSNAAEAPSDSLGELNTRALKQEYTLNNQLAQLRANDRRSLSHLPASQQRSWLATQHKQMEHVRRTEQAQRGSLESAGNKFNRLSTIRLIRKPPHTGNIHSLNQ